VGLQQCLALVFHTVSRRSQSELTQFHILDRT
jgi:hypothetical protein